MTTIGFTRPIKRLKESVKEAEEMGFNVIAAPSMKIIPGKKKEFESARELLSSGKASVVVFGSITSVEECLNEYGDDFAKLFDKVKIISIGPSTEKALTSVGISTDAIPEEFSSSGIVKLLKDSVKGKTVLLMRSDRGSEILYEGLVEAGANVIKIATYELEDFGMTNSLLHLITAIKGGRLDVMAFTSPMSARIFYSHLNRQVGDETTEKLMSNLKIAVIGNPTAEALRLLGREPDIIPNDATFRDMLDAIALALPISATDLKE